MFDHPIFFPLKILGFISPVNGNRDMHCVSRRSLIFREPTRMSGISKIQPHFILPVCKVCLPFTSSKEVNTIPHSKFRLRPGHVEVCELLLKKDPSTATKKNNLQLTPGETTVQNKNKEVILRIISKYQLFVLLEVATKQGNVNRLSNELKKLNTGKTRFSLLLSSYSAPRFNQMEPPSRRRFPDLAERDSGFERFEGKHPPSQGCQGWS